MNHSCKSCMLIKVRVTTCLMSSCPENFFMCHMISGTIYKGFAELEEGEGAVRYADSGAMVGCKGKKASRKACPDYHYCIWLTREQILMMTAGLLTKLTGSWLAPALPPPNAPGPPNPPGSILTLLQLLSRKDGAWTEVHTAPDKNSLL